MSTGAQLIDTPDGIAFFRVLSLKQALEAQAKGYSLLPGSMPKATAIAKRDYGLKGQAKTMAPIVAAYVEACQLVRQWSESAVRYAVETLDDLKAACEADKRKSVVFDHAQVERGTAWAVDRGDMPENVGELILAVDTVRRFEQGAKPAVRVVFRAEGALA